jgi:hypothetical protein
MDVEKRAGDKMGLPHYILGRHVIFEIELGKGRGELVVGYPPP